MMRKIRLLTLLVFLLGVRGGFSQSLSGSLPQSGLSPNISVDCSDPMQAASPECGAVQGQIPSGGQYGQYGQYGPSLDRLPQLRTPYGWSQDQYQYEYQYMYP